ncbi:MAG: hypothetical protein ACI9KI_000551 [Patiriisocius sp.]|jgi:hypothetical protein
MIFIEVDDVYVHLEAFKKLNLNQRFQSIKFSEVRCNDWGDEYFVNYYTGVLIHSDALNKPYICQF